jgi:ABC-type transporter MlaC component
MDEDSKEKRIKNFEEWISNKFPQYLSRLENELINLKKNSHHADKIIEITHNTEINIRKIILEEVRIELSNL